jgi:hypothetical protein
MAISNAHVEMPSVSRRPLDFPIWRGDTSCDAYLQCQTRVGLAIVETDYGSPRRTLWRVRYTQSFAIRQTFARGNSPYLMTVADLKEHGSKFGGINSMAIIHFVDRCPHREGPPKSTVARLDARRWVRPSTNETNG